MTMPQRAKDLRERVVEAVKREGISRHGAAARFGVGIKTAIDYVSSTAAFRRPKPKLGLPQLNGGGL